jgi:hypothetical protein
MDRLHPKSQQLTTAAMQDSMQLPQLFGKYMLLPPLESTFMFAFACLSQLQVEGE